MATDRDRSFLTDVPTRRSGRPDYILLPDLPDTLWHSGRPREGVLLDFFAFKSCAPSRTGGF